MNTIVNQDHTKSSTDLVSFVSTLRHNFDSGFAAPKQSSEEAYTKLLAIRLCGDPYALFLDTVSQLCVDKKLTGLPGAIPEFLGLASFRGTILPIYDLRVLLGYAISSPPRCLVTLIHHPIALAFDNLDACIRVPLTHITQQDSQSSARQLARVPQQASHCIDEQQEDHTEMLLPLIDLAAVVASIKQRVVSYQIPPKEAA